MMRSYLSNAGWSRAPRRSFGGPALALGLALSMATTLVAPLPALAGIVPLPDSTEYDTAELPNGIRVLLRHVPGAGAISISVAYPVGSDHDPKGQEGLAELLGEVAFTGAAGETPARSRAELDAIRPLGWSVEVGRRFTRFAESARPEQVPGVLHQMAERMRGVTVTREVLAAAQQRARAVLVERYQTRLDLALYNQLRDAAAGRSMEETRRYASGAGIAAIKPQDAQRLLAERLVPARAAIAVVGDLRSVPFREIVTREFGSLPERTAPELRDRTLGRATRVLERAGLDEARGAAGILGPALTDSLHPSFFFHTTVFGTLLDRGWEPDSLLSQRFLYSIVEDPRFARFYPPVRMVGSDSTGPSRALTTSVEGLLPTLLGRPDYLRLLGGMMYLIGGPMDVEISARVVRDPQWARVLANATATRLLWGDESFWEGYRFRLVEMRQPQFQRWQAYYATPENQAQVLMLPGGRRPGR